MGTGRDGSFTPAQELITAAARAHVTISVRGDQRLMLWLTRNLSSLTRRYGCTQVDYFARRFVGSVFLAAGRCQKRTAPSSADRLRDRTASVRLRKCGSARLRVLRSLPMGLVVTQVMTRVHLAQHLCATAEWTLRGGTICCTWLCNGCGQRRQQYAGGLVCSDTLSLGQCEGAGGPRLGPQRTPTPWRPMHRRA